MDIESKYLATFCSFYNFLADASTFMASLISLAIVSPLYFKVSTREAAKKPPHSILSFYLITSHKRHRHYFDKNLLGRSILAQSFLEYFVIY